MPTKTVICRSAAKGAIDDTHSQPASFAGAGRGAVSQTAELVDGGAARPRQRATGEMY
jgi:hypothetical protein